MTFRVQKNTRARASSVAAPNSMRQIFLGVVRPCTLVIVGLLVWYVTRLPFFTITDIQILGGETINHEEVRLTLINELEGSYFHLIPKQFTYLYPHERMLQVLEKNQRMHNIVLERTSRNELTLTFDEYVPYALWCTENPLNPICYFLTKDGYAFAEAPTLTGGTLVRHTVEGLDDIQRGIVIEKELLTQIHDFIRESEQKLGFRITSLVHTKDNDIRFFVNGGGMIFVAKGKDFLRTFENVDTVLQSDEFRAIEPGTFNYIDARFNNKIFVKEGPDAIATTTEPVVEEIISLPE